MDTEQSLMWLQRNRGKLILAVLAFIIASALLSFFSTHSLLYITVTGDEANQDVQTYASTDAETVKIGGSGLMTVPRKAKSILVTSSDYIKTQTTIALPWYGFLQKTITLVSDTNAEKIAYRSTTGATCASYNPSADKLLYYSCQNPKTILQYETPGASLWTNKKIVDIHYSGGTPQPYLGGVIGIAHAEATDAANHADIIATAASGRPTMYQAPEDTDTTALGAASIYTDMTDPTNKNFAFVDVSGTIYLGTPNEKNTVDYRKIPAPPKYNSSYNQTHCSVVADSISCYVGRTAVGDIPHDFDFSVTVSTYGLFDFVVRKVKVTV